MSTYEIFEKFCPELKPSVAFFSGDQLMITKRDKDGIVKTKPAVRDPNHKGFRYIWQEEINNET